MFFQNVASQNGLALFIKDSSKTFKIQNTDFSNNSVLASQNQIEGSVLFLENPGNISILNSFFKYNYGVSGTCMSYSETSIFNKFKILDLFLNID